MNCVSSSLALEQNEDDGSNNWNEVQWQIHDISDQGRRSELLKWALDQLSKLSNRVVEISALDFTSFRKYACLVPSNQNTIECINQSILDEECSRENVDQSRRFRKDKENGCEGCEWPVDEDQDGELWQIGEEEHGNHHNEGERYGWEKLGDEWLP